MQILSPIAAPEIAPRTAPPGAERRAKQTSADETGALNFTSLLVERQSRPNPTGAAAKPTANCEDQRPAKPGAAAAVPAENTKPGESAQPTGVAAAAGPTESTPGTGTGLAASETITPAAAFTAGTAGLAVAVGGVMADAADALAKANELEKKDAAAQNDAPQDVAAQNDGDEAAAATAAPAGSGTAGPAAAGIMPAILVQGLALQRQATAQGIVNAAKPEGAPAGTPAGASQQTSADGSANAMPAAPAAQPAEAPLAGAVAEATAVVAEPAAATAVKLVAAAKGRQTYGQRPVVSESQLVVESLKHEARTASLGMAPVADSTADDLELALDPGLADDPAVEIAAMPDLEQPGAAAADPIPAAAPDAAQVATQAANPAAAPVAAGEPAPAAPQAVPETVAPTETHAAVAAAVDLASAAARTDGTGATVTAPHANTEAATAQNIRQQVVQGFAGRLEAASGLEKMTIQLNPEGLGIVDLRFEAAEDRLTVVMSASSREAETALQDNLKDLTDRIVERSARFSQVEVRVELRDGAEARQETKQDQKQEGRHEQRRGTGEQDGENQDGNGRQGQGRQHDHAAGQTRLAWESAMNWQLGDQAAGGEG